jgi:hypothetical protein
MDEGQIIEEYTPGAFFASPSCDRAQKFISQMLHQYKVFIDENYPMLICDSNNLKFQSPLLTRVRSQ